MGGMSGSVRGKSKIETYLKYKEIAENHILPDPFPRLNKKVCKAAMVWDPRTEEWVLHFHLGK